VNRSRSAVLALGLFIVPSPGRSQVSPDRLDAPFLPFVSEGSPGFAVGVIHDGRLDLSRTYGLADLVTGARITESTCFRLASLTKQFTTAAIILLVRDGKRLDSHGQTEREETLDCQRAKRLPHRV
jgi:CubicO group peptidase (beta-lactamase class C family)